MPWNFLIFVLALDSMCCNYISQWPLEQPFPWGSFGSTGQCSGAVSLPRHAFTSTRCYFDLLLGCHYFDYPSRVRQ